MKVRITNTGEAVARTEREITEEQYYFLKDLFTELNDNGEAYCSYLYIEAIS